jgi:hypothetical protein
LSFEINLENSDLDFINTLFRRRHFLVENVFLVGNVSDVFVEFRKLCKDESFRSLDDFLFDNSGCDFASLKYNFCFNLKNHFYFSILHLNNII